MPKPTTKSVSRKVDEVIRWGTWRVKWTAWRDQPIHICTYTNLHFMCVEFLSLLNWLTQFCALIKKFVHNYRMFSYVFKLIVHPNMDERSKQRKKNTHPKPANFRISICQFNANWIEFDWYEFPVRVANHPNHEQQNEGKMH